MATEPSEREGLFFSKYTDIFDWIFYHRSMEKDKLFVLDVCGAYGQKDIEILDEKHLKRLGLTNLISQR